MHVFMNDIEEKVGVESPRAVNSELISNQWPPPIGLLYRVGNDIYVATIAIRTGFEPVRGTFNRFIPVHETGGCGCQFRHLTVLPICQ